jgi:hypothetical protein
LLVTERAEANAAYDNGARPFPRQAGAQAGELARIVVEAG